MNRATLIAIHRRDDSFSDRWLERCSELKIPHQVVDCHASDIVSRIRSSSALMWHWTHSSPADLLMARAVLSSAELMGLEVFPSIATCWHFDDKVAQKYLLEAAGAPVPRSWTFYELQRALDFVDRAPLPLVFKLRRGAGSTNVRLARTRREAQALARQAFAEGFVPAKGVSTDLKLRLARVRARALPDVVATIKRLPATLNNIRRARRESTPEKGYLYFQEFLPGNEYDTRVTVIGERAFAFTRNVRPGDFRASGSGSLDYDDRRIDKRCLEIAFDVARRVGSQSMAFDFVRDAVGAPRVVEVSFGYLSKAVHDCPGHWDRGLGWHPGHLWPEDAILDDLLARLEQRGRRSEELSG
jgi:glutathione synthase/RimK-type ligase-like ATP-grasp enzyme